MADERDDEAPDDLIAEVQRAVEALQRHADPEVRRQADALLTGIDAIHRTALARLVGTLQAMGGDALMTRLVADPAIRLLLMSYDLIAVDRRLQAEEALDAVRGHLHAHGVDVALLDVAGGVVYVQLHGVPDEADAVARVRHDLERALREGLAGFQQLEIGARQPNAAGAAVFVPLGGLRRPNKPVYETVLSARELEPGRVRGVTVGAEPVLLANVAGTVLAVRNRCGDGPLPLEFSALDDHVLTCSWHGCQYDVRTGQRLDHPGPRLPVYPVTVEDGDIRVAAGVAPA